MLFLKVVFIWTIIAFFIIIELISVVEKNREFFYGLIKDYISNILKRRNTGVIPDDTVTITKVKRNSLANVKFGDKLELDDEYNTIITILDKNNQPMDVEAPGSVFDEMYETLNSKFAVSPNEITRIDIKISRNDFDIMRLTHYKKQIDDITTI